MQSQKNCPIGTLKSFLREMGRHDYFMCFVCLFALFAKRFFYMTKGA